MDYWFPLIGGASAGAVISSVFALIKTRQDRSIEHGQWLRNQKIDVYTNLLRQVHVSVRHLHAALRGLPPGDLKLEDITDITNARLLIVGSQQVRSSASWHFSNLRHAYELSTLEDYQEFEPTLQLSEARLEEAIREDMDVVEKQAIRHSLRFWFYKYLIDPWRDAFESRYHRRHGHAWADRKRHSR